MVRLLYYKHPALVKPSLPPSLPPGPQAAPLSPAPPRPAAFWKKLPPTSKNSEPFLFKA
ncbi:hypothetical protein Bwad003_21960 [Bilophila wadsworthia]